MIKTLQLLFFLFFIGFSFAQNPKIKVNYFVQDGKMISSLGVNAGACIERLLPGVGANPTTTSNLEVRIHSILKSSTGPTAATLNSCTGATASGGAGVPGWSCENRCETSTNGGACDVWVPNGSQNALYPGNPNYIDTSKYPCTDIFIYAMKGFESDATASANLQDQNFNDGACAGTCNITSCYGNYQTPTSGDNNVTITIGQIGDTLRPFLGGVWSKLYQSNLESAVCTTDGFTNYYYSRWKYRWCWDDTTLFNRHAGTIYNPSLTQVCSNGLFNVTNETQAFEAAKGYSLYQWQYSNNGTTWTNFTNGTNAAANLIGCFIVNGTGSPVTYFIRREASFPIDFVAGAGYGRRRLYSDTVSIVILPTPTFTDPTLNSAIPANGTTICKGLNVSATFNAGGGTPYFDAFDEFQYSLNGIAPWTSYTAGASINTAFASGNVKIRGRRMSSCTATDTLWTNLVDWPVYSGTTSPSVASSSVPINTSICNAVTSITGVLNAGSGGADYEYGYSISNGTSPNAGTIVSGLTASTTTFTLNTAGATTRVVLFARRTNVGAGPCVAPSWGIVAYWTIINEPINPTLNTQTPNAATICENQSVSATFNTGSQGASDAIDQYQISIDNGVTWNAYTPATSISALGGNTNVLIQGKRTTGTSTGCTSSWTTLATWSIDKIPTGTPVFTGLSACSAGTTATASLTVNNLLPVTSGTSWTRTIGTTATPTTSAVSPFTITNLTTASRFRVIMTNGLCTRLDSVDVPLIPPGVPATVTIAPDDYCNSCTMANNTTKYFYDDAGKIIAMVLDSSAAPSLGLTEVCVDVDPVQKYVTDSYGSQQPYLRRRWTIKPGSNAGAAVTLYFTATELNDLKAAAGVVGTDPYAFTTPVGNLLITKYPNGGSGTFTAPLSAGAEVITPIVSAYNTTQWKALFTIRTFSTFYIHPKRGTISATLPVELISFNAVANDTSGTALITWITATEKNSKHFVIEKSTDASNWNEIGSVNASGNSNTIHSYSYVDNNLAIGIIYYRLKMVDLDNTFEYSDVVAINNTVISNKTVTLFPNPTNGNLNLQFYYNQNTNTKMIVKNVLGQQVKVIPVNITNQLNSISIDCKDLSNGTYFIHFMDLKEFNHVIKFLKY